jgi:hypothetical protein
VKGGEAVADAIVATARTAPKTANPEIPPRAPLIDPLRSEGARAPVSNYARGPIHCDDWRGQG